MRRIIALGTGAVLSVTMSLVAPSAASAVTSTVVVTPSDLVVASPGSPPTLASGQFVAFDQGDGTGGVGMVSGPASPPLGVGSLELSVTGSGSHWSVYTDDWSGTALSTIDTLSYSTYTNSTGVTAPVFQVVVDPGTPSAAGTNAGCITSSWSTLNFEPYLNASEQTLVSNTWQQWNVLATDGVVWGTWLVSAANNPHQPTVCTPVTPASNGGVSWSTFLSYYPDATIVPVAYDGGVGVNVGSGWSSMTGNVDALTIGASGSTTTYNFEPNIGPPTSKDQCKNGGWVTFNNPPFKNQGDCVSYVASDGRSR